MSQQPVEQQPASVSPIDLKRAPPAAPGRRRRNPWPRRGVIAAVVVAAVAGLPRMMKKPPLEVEVVKAVRGTVTDEISSASAGEVMAERDASVRAELSGRVLAVKHRRGDRVKKGEALVTLDASDLDARLRQAQATLEAQRAQVAQADAHAEAAKRTAQRDKSLAERGAETQQMADDSESRSREAAAAAQAAHAQLDQAAAALQVSRVARSHAELTAPFDGLLADLTVDPGDELTVGAVVFQVVDDSRLRVEAPIDEADIGKVKVGQKATLRLDALPDQPVAGMVSRMDPTVRKDEKGARTLKLEVEVSDLEQAAKKGLRPGMSANVDVRVAEKENLVSLPTNVIVGRGTKRTVYVVENGLAKEHQVQVGLTSWERSEIVSGVSDGQEVISSLNAKGLADGVPVKVKP
ncbi:MAG TPA: efflux RND transporter periplasmic adaptor subunit [Myxococcaceae bacterium]|jgi:HlyD family secretion protein